MHRWRNWQKTTLARYYLEKQGLNSHLHLIHRARIRLIVNYLPKAETIIDLGGAGSPLYQLGYTHSFKKMTIVDLPPEERDAQYKEIQISPDVPVDNGEIFVRYTNMIKLDCFS